MNIVPTNDLLLIRRIVVEEPRSAAGIYLPLTEDSADTPMRGVVLAAGPGKPAKLQPAGEDALAALKELVHCYHTSPDSSYGSRGISLYHWQKAIDALEASKDGMARIPMQVKVGDTVIFSKNGFQEFKINGETLIVTQEASIMGVIEQE